MIGPISVKTNLNSVLESLDSIPNRFDLRRDGIGDDIAEMMSRGMHARAMKRVNPQGRPWHENDPEYKAWKGNKPVGELTGDMLSLDNFLGEAKVTQTNVKVVYGKTEAARQKLHYFKTGRYKRNAWGLDGAIKREVWTELRARLQNQVHQKDATYNSSTLSTFVRPFKR